MDKLRAIRQIAHDRALSARAIDRMIGSEEFARLYSKCPEPDKIAAEQLTNSGDKDGLEAWMAARMSEFDIAALPIRELRQMGQKLGVCNYNRIPKALLISEIQNATQRRCQEIEQVDGHAPPPIDRCGVENGRH